MNKYIILAVLLLSGCYQVTEADKAFAETQCNEYNASALRLYVNGSGRMSILCVNKNTGNTFEIYKDVPE